MIIGAATEIQRNSGHPQAGSPVTLVWLAGLRAPQAALEGGSDTFHGGSARGCLGAC
jgi:hypothetical protein